VADPENPRFVVVLGPARSGTSLLRDLIAAHPAVAAVPFDVNHVWRTGNEKHPDDAFAAESADSQTADRIRGRLLALARRHTGAGRWRDVRFVAEKTVGNALRPDFVDRVLPGAAYVRIVRDPRRTIVSTISAWRSPPDVGHLARKARYFGPADVGYAAGYAANAVRGRFSHGRGLKIWGARYPGIHNDLERFDLETVCARQWLAAIASIDRFFEGLPAEKGLSVTYEDLVAGPDALARIWAFLGIAEDGLAARTFAEQVSRATSPVPVLPKMINGDTRAAVEARMADYGYV
jgi:hypothetical protein